MEKKGKRKRRSLKVIASVLVLTLVISTGYVLGEKYAADDCEIISTVATINDSDYIIDGKTYSMPNSWSVLSIPRATAIINNDKDYCPEDPYLHPYHIYYSFDDKNYTKLSVGKGKESHHTRHWGRTYKSNININVSGRTDVYLKFALHAKDYKGRTLTSADVKQVHFTRDVKPIDWTDAKALNDYSIKLSWNGSERAKGYDVYMSTSENGTYNIVGNTEKNTFTQKDLIAKKTYYYKIRPYQVFYGNKMYGEYSSVKAVKTLKAKIANVKNFKSKKINKKSVKLSWKKVKKAKGYVVYMSTKKDGTYKKIKTLKGNKKLSYTKKNLKKGTTYYFKVKAYTKIKGVTYYSNSSKICKR